MNAQPNLPPQSQDWGREMSSLIDATSSEIVAVENDINARMRGLSVAAQSLVGQTDMVAAAIDSSQPLRIEFSEVLGLIVNPDPAPVTKVTVVMPVPAGYNAVMFQAHGNGFVMQDRFNAFPIDCQIVVTSGSTTTASGIQSTPVQDEPSGSNRYYKINPSFTTFMPDVSGEIVVQLRMHTRRGIALDNGANSIALAVMANFYKGEVLLPPA